MARKKKWLYKKNGRYYGDFRSYADVGGGQEALVGSEKPIAGWERVAEGS